MKASLFAAAVGLLGSAIANSHAHGHSKFHRRDLAPAAQESCVCVTRVTTYWGEPTLVELPAPVAPVTSTTTVHLTSFTTVTVNVTASAPISKPAEETQPPVNTVTVYPTPGTSSVPPQAPVPAPAPPSSSPAPGNPTQAPEPPKETQPKVPEPPKETQPPKAPEPSKTPEPSKVPESSKVPEPSKVPTPKPSNPPGGGLGGGKTWGMTYSPYTNDGQCKGASAVMDDISVIAGAGFHTVRIYSSDCDGLKNVGNACRAHGLKLIIGVFISETGIAGAQKQVTDITSWSQWDLVVLVVIGNESIHSGRADAGALAGFISASKTAFQAAGYGGPVTTTETTDIWQAHGSSLCGVIDVLGANIHCFFNPDVEASSCGKFVAGQIQLLAKICPGKDVFNLETGWPTEGNPNKLAVPGTQQQEEAIKSLVEEVGSKSVFFSFTDDRWKDPGPYGIEQHWGCIKLFQ
ncbi:hypothetical protein MferCBS31731_006984 [Microsporum ferrugineum]